MNYLPHTPEDIARMLPVANAPTIEALFDDIPRDVYKTEPLFEPGMDEARLVRYISGLADRSTRFDAQFLGAGCYRHFIPSVLGRLASRPEFVTAYTPYQPEMSQGVLQAIYEYQTAICRLTGMDASDASLYDGATAACEAALLCHAEKRGGTVVASKGLHPHTIETLKTYLGAREIPLILIDLAGGCTQVEDIKNAASGEAICCVIAQSPNFEGIIEDMGALCAAAHEHGARFVASVNPLSLAILAPPGEYGADIAIGEGQPLGIPMSFGGPGLGFFAVKGELTRRMPGRIVGRTRDKDGNNAYVLTLQAREQHIRREKASSNICTNHSLCAVTASIYLAAMGPKGLAEAANACVANARALIQVLQRRGFAIENPGAPHFHEFVVVSKMNAAALRNALLERNILGGLPLDGNRTLWCATEMTTPEDLTLLDKALAEVMA